MNSECERFLLDEFLQMTLAGALKTRNPNYPVYADGVGDSRRKSFHKILRESLVVEAWHHREPVSEDAHIASIVFLSDHLSAKRGDMLHNRRFRIGTAQKALNLSLKYLWCLGLIATPPHCPFDSKVIKMLPDEHTDWTEMDDIEEYKGLVFSARSLARSLPLAEWELWLYNRDR